MTANLSEPLRLPRGPNWKNRIALAPLTNWQSHADGTLGEDEYRFLTSRAEGGFGMVMTCGASPMKNGVAFPGQLAVYADDHIPGLRRLADGLRERGAASCVQIHHAGSRANPEISGEQAVAPFANEKYNVRALTTDEVREMVDAFIAAAVRCDKAGMDGVSLHGAHGYVLCQFLSHSRNLRDDQYGGSYENRTRIYHEIIDGIRSATRPDFQLGCRISPEKYDYSTAEAFRFAQELVDGGKLDFLDLSLWDSFKLPDEEAYHPKRLVDVFGALDRSSGTRVGVAGHIFSTADAADCLNAGADFVFFGRGAILHQDLAARVLAEPDFVASKFPVTRAYLAEQSVGAEFRRYLATGWPNYVSD
ncbi:NADH:flavin oxidoreductase [Croceicoccus sp. YJ47]|uniref:NADH:flavin oxidoreductase n=1 Tax=Croceicoccus sp. YJ47 TaxID=2798724 RepID=UPI0019207BFF|nr:NADH:flavin oxidoreductase [Croceicoccus sp. YJ47]QQN75264.1 NADH:flavin oxidoreductase [Croceicoccus sp. YJ47]